MKKKKPQKLDPPFSDSEVIWTDSHKLTYLITRYEEHVKEAQKKGLEAFWWHVKSCNKKEPWQWITDEEMALLKEATDGSLKAICLLIEKNPNVLYLPFVTDRVIDLLLEYKYSQDKNKLKQIRDEWRYFLPDRSGGKNYISEEDLIDLMGRIMKRDGITKKKACERVAGLYPVNAERLYRMGSLAKRGRKVMT